LYIQKGQTGYSHSHFYSHFGFLKNRKSCFTPFLLVLFESGAGEGNRTLVFIPKTNASASSRIQPVITGEIHHLTPLFTTFGKYFPRNAITDHWA